MIKQQPTSRLAKQPTDAQILSTARVSDEVPRSILAELTEQQLAEAAVGRLQGGKLVHVYWPSGECALMFCAPGSDMPPPVNVIKGYRQNIRHQAQAGDTK